MICGQGHQNLSYLIIKNKRIHHKISVFILGYKCCGICDPLYNVYFVKYNDTVSFMTLYPIQ